MPDISYGMDENKKGEYVLYKDYAALAAENERLRKAGEMLFECIEPDIDDIGYNYGFKFKHAKARDAWLDAKKGRDAK